MELTKRQLRAIGHRPPYKILVAENYQQAVFWCNHIADPPINPLSRSLIILTNYESLMKLRGLRLIQGYDSVVYYTWPRFNKDEPFAFELSCMLPMIFREEI